MRSSCASIFSRQLLRRGVVARAIATLCAMRIWSSVDGCPTAASRPDRGACATPRSATDRASCPRSRCGSVRVEEQPLERGSARARSASTRRAARRALALVDEPHVAVDRARARPRRSSAARPPASRCRARSRTGARRPTACRRAAPPAELSIRPGTSTGAPSPTAPTPCTSIGVPRIVVGVHDLVEHREHVEVAADDRCRCRRSARRFGATPRATSRRRAPSRATGTSPSASRHPQRHRRGEPRARSAARRSRTTAPTAWTSCASASAKYGAK